MQDIAVKTLSLGFKLDLFTRNLLAPEIVHLFHRRLTPFTVYRLTPLRALLFSAILPFGILPQTVSRSEEAIAHHSPFAYFFALNSALASRSCSSLMQSAALGWRPSSPHRIHIL